MEVKSANPITISDKQKAVFVEKLLEAHELAKKNVETGKILITSQSHIYEVEKEEKELEEELRYELEMR